MSHGPKTRCASASYTLAASNWLEKYPKCFCFPLTRTCAIHLLVALCQLTPVYTGPDAARDAERPHAAISARTAATGIAAMRPRSASEITPRCLAGSSGKALKESLQARL